MLMTAALLALLVLGLVAVLGRDRDWVHKFCYGAVAASAAALTVSGLFHLGGNAPVSVILPMGLPWVQAHFAIDNLTALFLLILNIPATAASIYAIGYADHLPERQRVTPLFPLFLLGMNLALVAADAFSFLVAWEFMSLASWGLVLADHKKEENRNAAYVYIAMAGFGTFCLLACFGILAPDGDYSFAAMRDHALGPVAHVLVIVLAILGAGSKAGLVPLHAWLPLAHPAAPSHVSALMSAVMTKVAIYALIRVLFDLHGQVDWQWGVALMLLGAVTAVLGVLYAVMQDDLKKLLAYSTVENIGVVVIGLGLALAFKGHGAPQLAALALVAGLYHAFNHAIFKSLLFMGAGSVIYATHSKSLNALGGLLKVMPWTGALFLLAALAASSLPPLNGFVSEWLILQSLFKGPNTPYWAMKFGVPVVGALLALSAALAATCFVRAFGVAFLGRARTQDAAMAQEVPWTMILPMVLLAGICVIMGVMPVTVTDALSHVVEPLTGVTLPVSSDLGWPWLSPVANDQGSYSGTILIILGGVMLLSVTVLAHRIGTTRLRHTDAWDCGHPEDIANAQYSGDSFAQPVRRVYGSTLFAARETVVMPEPGQNGPASHKVRMIDPIWIGLYVQVARVVNWLADQVNRLQFLNVRLYLLLMFMTLVFLLLVVAVRQQL